MSWVERATDRSPAVQRSRDRSERQARAVVAAAERLLLEQGGSFTIHDVAHEAGISLQTFYRHFSSKDGLLLAVFEDIIARQSARYLEPSESVTDPLERLRQAVTASLEDTSDPPGPARRFLTAEYWRLFELFPEAMTEATRPFADASEKLLRDAVDAGQIHSDDPALDAWLIGKMVMAIYHHRAYAPHDAVAPLAKERFWAFCLAALQNPDR